MNTELIVSLIVPDTTAVTAQKTLARMGTSLSFVQRYNYYAFDAATDLFDSVAACDVLVNVNKHRASRTVEKKPDCTYVLVKDKDPATSLQTMLNDRFAFNITALEQGIIWELPCDEATAKNITEELLHNPHYQEYSIL